MTNSRNVIAPDLAGAKKPKAYLAAEKALAVEILQDNFASDAERDEFTQAVKMHGVTFLYLANSPLPKPSSRDMNMIERFARLLSRFWPQALVIGGCHD
ncbi:MAG: hypothetical protein AB7S81_01620 [Bdellovibrionales bacterium]